MGTTSWCEFRTRPVRPGHRISKAKGAPNDFPGWRVYLDVNAPLTTSAILDTSRQRTATERLARLFDAHQERLFRLACRLSSDREEARDLVQETFLRAAGRPDSLPDGEQSGEAWLVRTLVNLCRDRYRRLGVRSRVHESLKREETTEHPEDAAVIRSTVRTALERLAPRRRAAMVLHELEGVPVREVARLLGIAEVTVRWHLLAARRELVHVLGKENRK
jgi:RNA polymerase sigma factor (sigma-70 family)